MLGVTVYIVAKVPLLKNRFWKKWTFVQSTAFHYPLAKPNVAPRGQVAVVLIVVANALAAI